MTLEQIRAEMAAVEQRLSNLIRQEFAALGTNLKESLDEHALQIELAQGGDPEETPRDELEYLLGQEM